MPSNRMELPFPLKGISGDSAFGRTPEGMSPDALNVVGYDAVGGRLRGGQRPGLSKFWDTQLGSANRVQSLAIGTSSQQESGTATPITTTFDDMTPTNPAWSEMVDWDHFDDDAAGAATPLFQTVIDADVEESAIITAANSNLDSVHYWQLYSSGAPYRTSRIYTGTGAGFVKTGGYTVKMVIGKAASYVNRNTQRIRVFLRVNTDYGGEAYVLRVRNCINAGGTGTIPKVWLTKATTTGYVEDDDEDESVEGALGSDWRTILDTELQLTVSDTGSIAVKLYGTPGGVPTTETIGTLATMTDYTLNNAIGFGCRAVTTNGSIYVDSFRVDGVPLSEAGYQIRVAAACNGDVYVARAGYEPALAGSGSGALSTLRRTIESTLHHGSVAYDTAAAATHQMIYFADGTNWKRLDLNTLNVLTWTEDTAGGSLPVDVNSNTPTIIATYRDRIVLSGLIDDPQNWFMSAVGDAKDFDYGATPSATMAVAGNNSTAGKVGDIVTALAPYADDVMLMGGDHTIWIMRGDPASRGSIDNISHKTGIAGPRAFAWDPFGVIHFFGAGTHWMMNAGAAEPTPVSRGRMDRLWGALDLSSHDIQLAWDVKQQGLHILVVPWASGATTHWFWDQRTDAYWPIKYPNAMNPSSVLEYDADKDNDTALLFGGFGGYVRKVDATSKDDDGTLIDSYVLFNPINPGDSLRNTKLTEALVVLSSGTDAASLSVYSGDHPESAMGLGKLHFVRALVSGRNVVRQRAVGNTLILKLGNAVESETWALEALEVAVAGAGRTRMGSL